MESTCIGPFELIVSDDLRDLYMRKLGCFWTPIEHHYIGRFIARNIEGFIALPEDSALLGFHPLSPHIYLYHDFSDLSPADLCRYVFRRAISLRQNACKVRRNFFTRSKILRRTTEFVLRGRIGRDINSLYALALNAEQNAGDRRPSL
jgi:hypothetical protein